MNGRTTSQAATLALALAWAGATGAATITVTVDSQAGPWDFVGGGLNTAYRYGVHDFASPTLVSAADGFDFSPGGTFTIQYVGGLTSAFGGAPIVDAAGHVSYDASDNSGSSGNYFPSLHLNPADYPAYLNALIGTFADGSGAIVGTPFLVGNLRSVVAPAGAARLQLGINDDIFSDNTGSLTVNVTGPDLGVSAVDEPSGLALGGMGLLFSVAWARRRKDAGVRR